MAAGVTSDATDIMIYDNTDVAAGGDGSYSIADIYAVLGGTGVDILRVDSGTGVPTYRFLKNLQVGDKTTNAAATTLADSNVVCTFDAGKVLKTRLTQTTSWTITLGTKVGSGDQASGKKGVFMFFTNTAGTNTVILRGAVSLYGCAFVSTATGGTQGFQVVGVTAGTGDIVNCLIEGFFGATGTTLGSAAAPIANLYNVDISGDATNIVGVFATTAAERLTVSGNPATSYIINGSLTNVTLKDIAFFGTPATSDFRWTGIGNNWNFVRPRWSGNAVKFSGAGISGSTPDNAFHEMWRYDAKCVGSAGSGVPNIPVRLTDSTGVVQVDTTTGSDGEITFGSGNTANCAITADHYVDAGLNYAIRHRSPFLVEINMPYQTGYDNNYFSHRYYKVWPGYETITTSSGTFEDVNDIIPMAAPASGGSTWVERIVP